MKPVRFEISNITNLATIPRVSGVYLFRDPKDTVLYVGKARDLRQRIASYLRPGSFVLPKTGLIMKLAGSFEIIVTATEKEALILEALLIKEHRPKYNVVLRDDKAYPFLKLDIELDDSGLISEWLFDTAGRTVLLGRPVRGLKCRLLEMAETNAGQAMLSVERQHEAWQI
ncbi:MAG: GIY-YIG nuclease family protein [Thermodesulfobacteriota bacterium]|nr:GIY-YIG nuclease family protein [Thermodesulfobacteriota bacterium]